jgi:small subunit ribosomal protein S21
VLVKFLSTSDYLYDMLVIPVQNNNIEKALKVLKGKVIRTKQLTYLRDRQYYEKKSVRRRNEIKNAVYLQGKKDRETY